MQDSCGAYVVSDDCPEAGYSGWGEEAVPAVFKPLQSPPLQLTVLDLDPDTVKIIQERAKAKLDANKEYAHKAVVFSQGLFMKMYESLSLLGNVTSDSICVYLKVFSVTEPISGDWSCPKCPTSLILMLGKP